MSRFTTTGGYRALLIPDERLSPDTFSLTVGSLCTEAGPRPGIGVPAGSGYEASVVAAGEQGDTTYTIIATKGGFPDAGGEYAYAETANDVTGPVIGNNRENFARDIRNIGGGATSLVTAGAPTSIRTNTGRVIWAYCELVLAGSVRTVQISYTDDNITIVGADSSITLVSTDPASDSYSGYDLDNSDCVCSHWDSSRNVAQVWVRTVDPGNTWTQFMLFESEDDGESWTMVQEKCLRAAFTLDATARRPSVGYVAGSLVLLQPNDDGANYYLGQFVSYDNGKNFLLLSSDSASHRDYAMAEFRNSLQVAAINWDTGDTEFLAIASSGTILVQSTWATLAAPSNMDAIGICVQHNRLLLYGATNGSLTVMTSQGLLGTEDGVQVGDLISFVGSDCFGFEGPGSNVNVADLAPVPALGGVLLACTVAGTGVATALRNKVYSLRMGGWATVTLPECSQTIGSSSSRVSFGPVNLATTSTYYAVDQTTYLPFLAPDAITGAVWTAAGTGTDASAMTAGNSPAWSVSCGAGTHRYWSYAFTGDLTKGVLLFVDFKVSSGGSSLSSQSGIRVSLSDGATTEYRFTLRITSTGMYVRDEVGGTTSNNIESTTGNRRSLIIAMRELEAGVSGAVTFYRAKYDNIGEVQELDQLHDGSTYVFSLSPDGTPAANSTVDFGVLAAAGSLTNQEWYSVQVIAACDMPGIYELVSASFISNTDTVGGAPCVSTPSELANGLKIGFAGGPVSTGNSWSLAPRYDYAKENVYPALYPSPRTTWRSTSDGATRYFEWLFDADNETPEGLGAAIWGAAVIGANFANWKLDGYTAAGSWENILTVDSSDEFTSLPYRASVRSTFTGAYVTVDTGGSGSASRYIHENELAGGTVKIGSSYLKIARNTSGYWSTAAGKKPVLFMESWDSALTSTGTLDIWPPNSLALKTGLGSTEYRRLRFSVTASSTADGYYEIGSLVIGPVYLFGKQYSKGRVLTRKSGTVVNYATGGASNPVVLSPTRRSVEFGWFEGLDQTDIYAASSSSEPTYVTTGDATGPSQAAAARHDTPTNLDGLYVRLDGGNVPVVYIPHIPYDATESQFTTTDGRTLNGFIYGRIDGDVKLTTVQGTEQHTEVSQIAAITINEDI